MDLPDVATFCEFIGKETLSVSDAQVQLGGKVLGGFMRVLDVVQRVQGRITPPEMMRFVKEGAGDGGQIDLYVWDGFRRYTQSANLLIRSLSDLGLNVYGTVNSFSPRGEGLVCEDHIMFKSRANYDLVLVRAVRRRGFI